MYKYLGKNYLLNNFLEKKTPVLSIRLCSSLSLALTKGVLRDVWKMILQIKKKTQWTFLAFS